MSEILSGTLAAALNRRVISDAFEIIRPNINGVLALASMAAPEVAEEGHKVNWLDFTIGADSDVTTAISLAADTTIDVTKGSLFRKGMLLSTGASDEIILVESVASNVLTVVRGFGGTTAADIASGADLSIDSVAREENSLTETDGIYQPEEVGNYFQTMDTAIEMSRRALASLQIGNTNDLNFQIQQRITQLANQMNKALLRGRKATATIDGKERTFTGGLGYFLDQAGAYSVDNAAAALTLDTINQMNAELVKRGGMSDTIVVGIDQARKLQALAGAQYSSQRLGDWSNDAGALVRLPTDLPLIGSVNTIVIDTNMKGSELLLLNSSRMEIVPMAQNNAAESGAWRTLDATAPGQDGQIVRVIGDFAFRLRDTKSHFARLTNIAV